MSLETVMVKLRAMLFFIAVVGTLALIVYSFFASMVRRKKFRNLDNFQQRIIRSGKVLARKKRLNRLYITVNGDKPVFVGKIDAYVPQTYETNKDGKNIKYIYSVFAIRSSKFSDYKFYRVNELRHTRLEGDIKLLNWNFILSKTTGYYEINNNKAPSNDIEPYENEMIDVVGNIHPIIQKSVLADPFHRKEVRKSKLIKLQHEDTLG